jgi:5-methyltetrahydrofolate--homocysteine methyltransferase
MGIVNAGQLAVYEEIAPELLEAVEDVILNRRPDATERLTDLATATKGKKSARKEDLSWRDNPVAERLSHALLTGEADFVEEDTLAALEELAEPLKVIEGPLMDGLNKVGDLFGAGKMFLPQVIRSARVMKKAVAVLDPYLLALKDGGAPTAGKILLATVKGDVHDIGKNIVGVVLGCNNYEIIDLGVMVPVNRIIETAVAEKVDMVGLSGLITPSLAEMTHVAQEMDRAGLSVPLLIGGATTSRVHTAVKIAPFYEPGVFYVPDASKAVGVIGALINPETREEAAQQVREEYEQVRRQREAASKKKQLLTLSEAREHAPVIDWSGYEPPQPARPGVHVWREFELRKLVPFIDWTPFLHTWRLPGRYPQILDDPEAGAEARRLMNDAETMLDELISGGELQAAGVCGLFPAQREGDDLILFTDASRSVALRRVPFLRQQRRSAAGRPNHCLADFVAPGDSGLKDWVGGFVVTAGLGAREAAAAREARHDDYRAIMVKALADRLAEAFAEYLHAEVRREIWAYAPAENLDNEALIREEYRGIRPAPGYPACPDHLAKKFIFTLLDAEENTGAFLTENCAMEPAASVAGWYFSHPEARYFGLGRIGQDQVADYAVRAGISQEEAAAWLAPNLD